MKRRGMRNLLMGAAIMLYLLFAVLATTACSGAGSAANREQVQITFGTNERVTFATLYDALAWLNSSEYNGNYDAGAANGGRGNNGYLKEWEDANNKSGQYTNGRQPSGEFQITVLTQNAVENKPGYSPDNSGDKDVIAKEYDEILKMDEPYASVTLATNGKFNLNMNPENSSLLSDLDVGYAHLTLDGSVYLVSSHAFYMNGNDMTVASGFRNGGSMSILSGWTSGDKTAVSAGVGLNDGQSDIVIDSDNVKLTTLSGGNLTGTYNGDSSIVVNRAAAIQYLYGAGGAGQNSATGFNGDLDITVNGGTITTLSGMGNVATPVFTSGAVNINVNGGVLTNLWGGGAGYCAVNAGAQNVNMTITGGTIRTNVYGTQASGTNSKTSTYYDITMNIDPGNAASKQALRMAPTVAGTYNSVCNSVVMNVYNAGATGTDYSTVKNWYVGNQAQMGTMTQAPAAGLLIDAPGATFQNIYLTAFCSDSNTGANGKALTATVKAAKSIVRLSGWHESVVTAANKAMVATIEMGNGNELQNISIQNTLSGFSALNLDMANVTVANRVRPMGVLADFAEAAPNNAWEYVNHAGNVSLENGSTLTCPARMNSAIFYNVMSDGSDNYMYGYAGNVSNATTFAHSGILVTGMFENNIQVGANGNAPTVKWGGTNLNALRTIITHYNQTIRDAGGATPAMAAKDPLHRTFWGEDLGIADRTYTFLGLMDDKIVQVNKTGTAEDVQRFTDLTNAMTYIQQKATGDYTVTFLADYNTVADWVSANAIVTDKSRVITFTGFNEITGTAQDDGSVSGATYHEQLSDQMAPAGTSRLTVPGTWNMQGDTALKNLAVQSNAANLVLQAMGKKVVVDGGVQYYANTGLTKYIELYGAHNGKPAANDGIDTTDVTLKSGTYSLVMGGYLYGPSLYQDSFDAGNVYNLTINGGDFTGGIAPTAKTVTTADGNLQDCSYVNYGSNVYQSLVSASYVSVAVNGSNDAHLRSNCAGANLTFRDEEIGTTGSVYTMKAPGGVVGMMNYGIAGPYYKQPTDVLFNESAPSITIDTEQNLNFGGVAGGMFMWKNGSGYASFADLMDKTVKLNINAPNSSFDMVLGLAYSYNDVYSTEVTLKDVGYIDKLAVGCENFWGAGNILNQENFGVLNIEGEANVGGISLYSKILVDGEKNGVLNVLSNTAGNGTGYNNDKMQPIYNGADPSAGAYGNLVLKDGGIVNLYGNTASQANNLVVEGTGNQLNVVGNQNTAAGMSNGVLNVYKSCDISEGDGLILGLTSNSTLSSANALDDGRIANIIGVMSPANLKAAEGATGAYWDYTSMTDKSEGTLFTANTNTMSVRSDAYKNYVTSVNGIVLKNDSKSNGTTTGFMYLGEAITKTDFDLIMVVPAPGNKTGTSDELGEYAMYGTLEAAANGIISGTKHAGEGFQITILSGQPYVVTAADAAALKNITSANAYDLTIDGDYSRMPSDYVTSSNVLNAPAQGTAAVNMGTADLSFDKSLSQVVFKDLVTIENPLSFKSAKNVTVEASVFAGILSKANGATYTGMAYNKTIDDVLYAGFTQGEPSSYTFMAITGENTGYYSASDKMFDGGDGKKFYVDQNGNVWRPSTSTDFDMNNAYNAADALTGGSSASSKYQILAINGKPYTKTSEQYVVAEDGTLLELGNVNGITDTFQVQGNRTVVVTKGMNSPTATVSVVNRLALQPTSTSSSYTYSINTLNAKELVIPKYNSETHPLITKTLTNPALALGIACYGEETPQGGDDLIKGATGANLSSYTYSEIATMLEGNEIVKSANLVELKAVPGAHANSPIMLQKSQVYSNPATKTFNDAEIVKEGNARYLDADGNLVSSVTAKVDPVANGTTTLTDTVTAIGSAPYKVNYVFTGAGLSTDPAVPSNVVVDAYVFDNVITEPDGCKIGYNDITAPQNDVAAQAAKGSESLLDWVIKQSNAKGIDRYGQELTILKASCAFVKNEDVGMDLLGVKTTPNLAGTVFEVALVFGHSDSAETHTERVRVTLEKQAAGIYANNFTIKAADVYTKDTNGKDTTTYNLKGILAQAEAYWVDAAGASSRDGIEIVAATTTLKANNGVYDVTFKVTGQSGAAYTKTVQATVTDEVTIETNPAALDVKPDGDLQNPGTTTFTASDPVTGQPVDVETWEASAIDKDGKPINGVTIDADGKLTIPELPTGAVLTVTAKPVDKDLYEDGTYETTIGGDVTPDPNRGISANHFSIGVDAIAAAGANLETTAKEYSGVKAWNKTTKEDLTDAVTVATDSLNALKTAKKGDVVPVVFTIMGEGGQDVETVVNATITDHSTYENGIVMTANNFEYGDAQFAANGSVLTTDTAKNMIIMLAQAKATKAEDGSTLSVSLATTELNKLKQEEGYVAKGLSFTATADSKTSSVTADGYYRSENVVKPVDPVVPTPEDPDPDYKEDIQISANDFIFGNELFRGNTLDEANVDKWAIMLAEATAKKVSDGTPLKITEVSYVPTLTKDENIAFKVTFTATNGATNGTADVTVIARYSNKAVVDPTTPVDPADPDITLPDPDYGGDIQLNAYDFTATLESMTNLKTQAMLDAFIKDQAKAAAKVVSTGAALDVTIKSSTLKLHTDGVYTAGEYTIAFTATNPETGMTKDVTIKATITSQKLVITGADKVEPPKDGVTEPNTYPLNVKDELGQDRTPDSQWKVTDPKGNPIPGMTIDTTDPTKPLLKVEPGVDPGTDFVITADIPDEGKSGEKTGTVQGDKPPIDPDVTDNPNAIVEGGNLMPGSTAEFKATDPNTNQPLTGGKWTVENPKTPDGSDAPGLVTTNPNDPDKNNKIFVDPETGIVAVGENVPVGSTVDVVYTPAEGSNLDPGSQWAEVQPGAAQMLTYDYRPGTSKDPTKDSETHNAFSTVTTRGTNTVGTAPEGKTLFAWDSDVTIDGQNSFLAGKTFQMPNSAVTLTANWKDHVNGSIAANDFKYGVESGKLSAEGAKNLAGVKAFDKDGKPVDLTKVKVNEAQLKAINDAIAAGQTTTDLPLTFTNPGVDLNNDGKDDSIGVTVDLTSQKLEITGADKVTPPAEGATTPTEYPLNVTDDNGDNRNGDAEWSVADPKGDPIPGMSVDTTDPTKPVLKVEPGVVPGTDFVISATIPDEDKSGDKTGTIQGDKPPVDPGVTDNPNVEIEGGNLKQGETTPFTATDPTDGNKVLGKDDGKWSVENPKNADGTSNPGLVTTNPNDPNKDQKIFVDPDTGEVTVGKDVPVGSTVEVTYTPNATKHPNLDSGSQLSNVQAGAEMILTYDYRPGTSKDPTKNSETHNAFSTVTTRGTDTVGTAPEGKTLFAWNSDVTINNQNRFLPGKTFQMPKSAVTLAANWKDHVDGSIAANDFNYAIEGGILSEAGTRILAGVELFDKDGNQLPIETARVDATQRDAINEYIRAGRTTSAGQTLPLTFTNPGVDVNGDGKDDNVTIQVTLSSQKLNITGADDVKVPAKDATDPITYPLGVTDDKGNNRSEDANWSVTDPAGNPIPGMTVDTTDPAHPVLKVEPGVDPGTDFVITAEIPEEGKSGEKTGTTQESNKPDVTDPTNKPDAEVHGDNLAPGQTTQFTATDPTDNNKPLEGGEWSVENPKNPDGTENQNLVTTNPNDPNKDQKIFVDPVTGEVTVGKDVPVGSTAEITYTPDPVKTPHLDPGKQLAEVQPVEVTSGITVVKPTDPIYPGSTSDPFKAIDNKTGEPLDNVTWSVVDPETGNPVPGISMNPDGSMTVAQNVKPSTPYKVIATLPDGRTGAETGEIQNEPGIEPTTDPTLNITGPDQPLVPGGTSEFKATDPETGEDVTEDPDTEWTVQVKDPNGNWVNPDKGTVTIENGKVTVDPNVDPGTEIKVTATNGDKTGSEEATIQKAPLYEYEFEIIKVTHKGETTDLTKTDGEQVSILTGAWNDDQDVTYTFRMKVKPFTEGWRAATAEEIQNVQVNRSAIGGFQMLKSGNELFTADNFITWDGKITTATGTDASYGYGQFTLHAVKSGIVNTTVRYGSNDANTGDNTLIAVVPGDVNRNGVVNAADGLLVYQKSGGATVAEANLPYANELMDMSRNGISNAADGLLIYQMAGGMLTPSN